MKIKENSSFGFLFCLNILKNKSKFIYVYQVTSKKHPFALPLP